MGLVRARNPKPFQFARAPTGLQIARNPLSYNSLLLMRFGNLLNDFNVGVGLLISGSKVRALVRPPSNPLKTLSKSASHANRGRTADFQRGPGADPLGFEIGRRAFVGLARGRGSLGISFANDANKLLDLINLLLPLASIA
jgi:hypothetical protein